MGRQSTHDVGFGKVLNLRVGVGNVDFSRFKDSGAYADAPYNIVSRLNFALVWTAQTYSWSNFMGGSPLAENAGIKIQLFKNGEIADITDEIRKNSDFTRIAGVDGQISPDTDNTRSNTLNCRFTAGKLNKQRGWILDRQAGDYLRFVIGTDLSSLGTEIAVEVQGFPAYSPEEF